MGIVLSALRQWQTGILRVLGTQGGRLLAPVKVRRVADAR